MGAGGGEEEGGEEGVVGSDPLEKDLQKEMRAAEREMAAAMKSHRTMKRDMPRGPLPRDEAAMGGGGSGDGVVLGADGRSSPYSPGGSALGPGGPDCRAPTAPSPLGT